MAVSFFSTLGQVSDQTLDQVISNLQAVDLNMVNHYIKSYFDLSKLSLVVVGDTKEGQAEELLQYIRG